MVAHGAANAVRVQERPAVMVVAGVLDTPQRGGYRRAR
jgi:hypothetical protein